MAGVFGSRSRANWDIDCFAPTPPMLIPKLIPALITPEKIATWIDKKQMVDLPLKDRRISVRLEVELSRPLGIATYNTSAALREIKVQGVK